MRFIQVNDDLYSRSQKLRTHSSPNSLHLLDGNGQRQTGNKPASTDSEKKEAMRLS
jgi:hypothetical protein